MNNNLQYPILSTVGIIKNEVGQILITKRNVAPYCGLWVMPGGKVNCGESVGAATLREIKEEVGLDGKLGELVTFKESLPSQDNKFRHYVILYFQIHVSAKQSIQINTNEVAEVAWIDRNNYQNYEIPPKAKEVLQEIFHSPNASR